MENVASVIKITVSAGSIIPCIKILRGLDVAARQQNATFMVHVSFSYPVAGVIVNIPDSAVLLSRTTGREGGDPVWQNFDLPAIAMPRAADAGSQITCNTKIIITGVTGIPTDVGYLDTALLTPS